MKTRSYRCYAILLSLLAYTQTHAFNQKLIPRFYGNAYANTEHSGLKADGMLPAFGDEQHNVHADLQAITNTDSQWLASLGVGYRWIANDAGILGLYLFGDRTREAHNSYFWLASPGIEYLGIKFDASINGYFPVGHKRQVLNTAPGEQFGLPTATFSGHTKHDFLFQQVQEIGNGTDLILGYNLKNLSMRTILGAYYFNLPASKNITGVAAGLDYWINPRLNLTVRYNYDNLHRNTASLGLSIYLGETHHSVFAKTVAQRITDPIARLIAQSDRGSSIPSRTVYRYKTSHTKNSGHSNNPIPSDAQIITEKHIYFFDQTVTDDSLITNINQCTFKNPCGPGQFHQENINNIAALDDKAILYFNGGHYNALNVVQTKADVYSGIVLAPNQWLESRNVDYKLPASDSQRTVFYGGFQLSGNNILTGLSLQQQGSIQAGILIENVQNNWIDRTVIGDKQYRYRIGIDAHNADGLLVSNSDIFANVSAVHLAGNSLASLNGTNIHASRDDASGVYGVHIENNSDLSLDKSQVLVNNTDMGDAVGLFIQDQAKAYLHNSSVTASMAEVNASYGIVLQQNAHLESDGTDILAISTASDTYDGKVVGIMFDTSKDGMPSAHLYNDSSITAKSAKSISIGIQQNVSGPLALQLENSTINAFSTHNIALGISWITDTKGTMDHIQITGAHIQVNGTDDSQPISGKTTSIINGSTCSKNGRIVKCDAS